MYKLYPEVQIVEGYSSSLVYDLGRINVSRISNELLESFSNCKRYLKSEDGSDLLKDFLLENDFAFKSDKFDRDYIKEIDLTFHQPNHIKRLILKSNNLLSKELVEVIDWAVCPLVMININDIITSFHKEVIEILKQQFYLRTIIFIVDELDNITKNYIESITSSQIYIISQTESNNLFKKNTFFTSKAKSTKDLELNLYSFIESKTYDVFFNKLIILDDVKDSKDTELPFVLTIRDKSLMLDLVQNRLQSNEYLSYSKKKKIETSICKDCEFKHMCIDERLPYKRKNDDWYHKDECNYNPYICKWKGEEGYQTLSDCGVTSTEKEFSINHERINEIISNIWG